MVSEHTNVTDCEGETAMPEDGGAPIRQERRGVVEGTEELRSLLFVSLSASSRYMAGSVSLVTGNYRGKHRTGCGRAFVWPWTQFRLVLSATCIFDTARKFKC